MLAETFLVMLIPSVILQCQLDSLGSNALPLLLQEILGESNLLSSSKVCL
jgi:hypothetical protein